jgi:hypothetical protein
MRKSLPTIGLIALLAACGTAPNIQPKTVTTPIQTTPIVQPKPARVLGLVEVKFTDVGKDSFSAQAVNIKTTKSGLSSKALTDVTAGLQLSSSPVARGSSDVGARGAGGHRYIYTSFRVRNANGTGTTDYAAQSNLAFVAVETVAPAAPSVTGTAIRNLRKFDGTAFSSTDTDAIAPNILPASPVTVDAFTLKPTVIPNGIDAMQVFTETEASDLKTVLSPSSGSGVNDVLPYGFVVTNSNDKSRTLPAPANATDFAGVVTFAVKVPLQATAAQDPFSFSMMFEVVSDSSERVTQSLEGQDLAGSVAIVARAKALGVSITSLGGSSIGSPLCAVRGSGPASSPLSYLVNALAFPSVTPTANSNAVLANANIDFGFAATMNALNSSSLTVNGSQTGLHSGTYSGAGTNALGFDPGSDFKPGEEVEVRLGNPASSVGGQGLCQPKVWRFRAGVAAGGGDFPGKTYPTNSGPRFVTLGDVNGDGKSDLIAANQSSNNVSVLLGNGNGTFQAKVDYATATEPRSVALRDVNSDTKLDVITANTVSNKASVLLGNGDGTFQTKVDYTTGSGPYSVSLDDVNGDTKLDMVTANSATNTVSVLFGNGNGTFQAKVDYVSGTGPYSVTLKDVNGDSQIDILTANNGSSKASVLLNNGNGTFITGVEYATGLKPQSITVGDLNADNKLDLITANVNSSNVSVLLGNGDGTFQSKIDYVTGTNPYSVTLGDTNADGKLDLLAGNATANTVSILLGNGDGTFQTKVDYNAGVNPYSVTLSDVNGDTKLDIVTANFGSNGVTVILGNGDGSFQSRAVYATGTTPRSIKVGDINADGVLDLVTANNGASTVSVLLGDGIGKFATKTDYATGSGPTGTTLGDFNGDGRLDIVTVNNTSRSVSVLLNDGSGGFQTKQDYPTNGLPLMLTSGDLNADGKPDLVVSSSSSGANALVSVLFGNGDGSFQTSVSFPSANFPNLPALGDLNADNRLDLVTPNGSGTVSVLFGDAGSFLNRLDIASPGDNQSVAIGDLNNDGKPDLVIGVAATRVSVMLGNGDGTFQAKQDFPMSGNGRTVTLGDMNGDGKLDIVTTNSNNVSVFFGDGVGGFSTPTDYVAASPYAVDVGDFNADGRLDIATAGNTTSSSSVLLNQP